MDEEEEYQLGLDSNTSTGRLRKDVSTRWTSTFEMVSSFMGKINVINTWLRYVNRTEIAITEDEEQFLPYLIEFFKLFAVVTKSIEGSLYSTINLAVIFSEELNTQLSEKVATLTEIDVNQSFKDDLIFMYETALDNLDRRLQITDEMICATLLDPTFQHSQYVKHLLDDRFMSRKEFLKQMYEKYVGPCEKRLETLIESDSKPSFIQELARKYSKPKNQTTFDIELDSFFKTEDNNHNDLTIWWCKIGKFQFPVLSKLARIILGLSATSANVERLNSIAGATSTKFRQNLHHLKFEKIMMTLYNYRHLNQDIKKEM